MELTASDITITLNPQDRDPVGSRWHNRVSIAFGDGSKTYPSGGIPLPDKSKFGILKELDLLQMQEPCDGYLYRYDKANHKLRIFYPTKSETDSLSASVDAGATAVTSTAANGSIVSLSGQAGVPAGAAEEVGTSFAPAATVIEAMVIGK